MDNFWLYIVFFAGGCAVYQAVTLPERIEEGIEWLRENYDDRDEDGDRSFATACEFGKLVVYVLLCATAAYLA